MLHFPASDTFAFWRQQFPSGRAEEYRAGTVLFHEGANLRSVFLVERGIVELTIVEPVEGLDRCVAWRGPGHWLGHSGAILGIPLSATFTAATDCRIRRLSVQEFLGTIRPSAPSSLWKLCEERTLDLVDLMRNLALTVSRGARQRLEFVLSQLVAQQHGPGAKRAVSLDEYSPTNDVLGGYVGVNPKYISRLFAELKTAQLGRRLPCGRIIVSRPSRLFRPMPVERNPSLSIAQWKELLKLDTPEPFERHRMLFRRGEPVDGVYLVEKGVVDFSIEHPVTSRPQAVLWIGAGQLAGASFVLTSSPASVTAETATACSIHHVAARRFLDALDLERQPVLGPFVAELNKDVVTLVMRLALQQLLPLSKQLQQLIWQLSIQYTGSIGGPEGDAERFSPTTAMFARYLATREDYIRRLIQDLRWRGAISRQHRNPMLVTDPSKLFHLGDPDRPE